MHGYAKIKLVNGSRSNSVDLSDLISSPHTQKTNENITPNHKEIENINVKNINGDHFFFSEMEDEEDDEVKKKHNSMKLSRNSSVSSTASQRFKLDRQSSKKAIQSAVKRAFSVSRSSSVSERYCRIHDQYGTPSSPLNDDDDDVEEGTENDAMQTRSMKKKKTKKNNGVRILKACKRLFGL